MRPPSLAPQASTDPDSSGPRWNRRVETPRLEVRVRGLETLEGDPDPRQRFLFLCVDPATNGIIGKDIKQEIKLCGISFQAPSAFSG